MFQKTASGIFIDVFEEGGKYQNPERVTLGLQDSISIGNPMVAPDERFLLFSSSALPGEGGSDLFVSMQTEAGNWGETRNLGPLINSAYADFAPAISPDGQYLFFHLGAARCSWRHE